MTDSKSEKLFDFVEDKNVADALNDCVEVFGTSDTIQILNLTIEMKKHGVVRTTR